MIDDGKPDKEISRILGIGTHHLRKIRDENNRSRSVRATYTIDQINDVIDMIRERIPISKISAVTGVNQGKIRRLRDEEVREGNHLPEILTINDVVWSNGMRDEEVIELIEINQGYGVNLFCKTIGITILRLTEFSEFIQQEFHVDLFEMLNEVPLYTESEFKQKFRERPTIHLLTYREHSDGTIENVFRSPLNPEEFDWGKLSHFAPIISSRKFEAEKITDWANRKIRAKGYIDPEKDQDDFRESCKTGLTKIDTWARKIGLQYNEKIGRWTKPSGWDSFRENL